MTIFFCSGLLLVTSFVANAAPIITITPPVQMSTLGTTASENLHIDGLGNGIGPSLGTFDVTVKYDAAILGNPLVTFGDPQSGDQLDLFTLGSITSIIFASGSIELFELSLDSSGDLNALQAPAFTLGTITFTALKTGTSPLSITVNALGNADGNPLDATTQGASITVTAESVPEPGTSLLCGAGLLLLLIQRRSGRSSIGGIT